VNKDKELIEDLVCVKTYNNRIEAGFAMSILESEDILSFISADDCGGAYSALSKTYGGVKLLVRKEDLKMANDLLEDICEK
jgi:hypothetical protein